MFSKNVMEKPHLVCTYNVITLCALLSDFIDLLHSLASHQDLGVGLYKSRPFSRLLAYPIPFSF